MSTIRSFPIQSTNEHFSTQFILVSEGKVTMKTKELGKEISIPLHDICLSVLITRAIDLVLFERERKLSSYRSYRVAIVKYDEEIRPLVC
jgi:hypothetical protein